MPVTTSQVLLYYPNLIGYVRITCMFLSFYFAMTSWKASLICYLIAFGGDVVDGHVARAFNQSSEYGGILDMVTDRVSTAGLLVILSNLYSEQMMWFICLIVLDIGSHWFHVMSVAGQHHKSAEALQHRNPMLRWYYSIYPLFGYCCVGTEMFYVLLYVRKFYPHPVVDQLCFYGCLPACILKQVINVVQFASAADSVAERDAAKANDKTGAMSFKKK